MILLTALSVHVLDAYLNSTEEYCEFESNQNGLKHGIQETDSSQILFAVSIYFLLLKIFFLFLFYIQLPELVVFFFFPFSLMHLYYY